MVLKGIVIDLLLPQYTPTFPSPFLSHPLIRQVLDHTWRNGSARVVTPDGVVSLSTMTRLKWRLHSAITLQYVLSVNLVLMLC